jgi:ABC-type sugar transport system ATPase subunit
MPPLLEVRNLTKSFGPTRALRGAEFVLQPGEIHALVGENGAGKSTLIKILAGVHPKDAGEIMMDGQVFAPATPRGARDRGISTVFQELSLCPNLSVAENILANREPVILGLVKRKELYRRAEEFLKNFSVPFRPDDIVGDLTVAQRQIIEILKALSVRARVLILDEPTSALDDRESRRLLDLLRSIQAGGTGIIYVSHKLNEVFEIAGTITVFRDGEHVATKPRGETNPEEIIRFMVGREISQVFPPKATAVGQETLSVEGFSSGKKFRDISLKVRKTEIVGVAGLAGSGRTDVMQAIFGYRSRDAGSVRFLGRPINIDSPAIAIRNRIVYAPEDRKDQGLFLDHSVEMNTTATCLGTCSGAVLMSPSKEEAVTREMVNDLSIKTGSIDQPVGSLSGGNQQKVLLAKCLATKPEVLIVDEPTRGIDIGSKIEIYALLRRYAEQGGSVILVSSELPEIVGLSDRVLVFNKGRIAGELTESITEQAVLRLMFKHTDTAGNAC